MEKIELISKKQNCWEYMKCEGPRDDQLATRSGICRSSTREIFNEINSGKNGGRICFAVVGTFSSKEIQGLFAKELTS